MAFWCSDICRAKSFEDHASYCTELKEIAALDYLWHTWDKSNAEPFMILSLCSARTYMPPSTFGSWSDYYQTCQIFKNVPPQTELGNHGAVNNGQLNVASARDISHASKAGSNIMTILRTLEYTIPDLATRSNHVIHIIGAAEDELSIVDLNEDLLHHCSNLTNLMIGYWGPGVPKNSIEDATLCGECQKNDRSLTMAYVQQFYHNVRLTNMNGNAGADLICAFNSGHYAENPLGNLTSATWTPTLNYILHCNTPAVFTTYTALETGLEQDVMDTLGAEFIMWPRYNPWRSLVGSPLDLRPTGEMRYKNHYWYIVKGFKEEFQPAAVKDESEMLKAILDRDIGRLRLSH
ncbi:MAG: hypothetical protein Q9221_001083 [Calogaya cf. arnoldii]